MFQLTNNTCIWINVFRLVYYYSCVSARGDDECWRRVRGHGEIVITVIDEVACNN
jgi:hypothetical protein